MHAALLLALTLSLRPDPLLVVPAGSGQEISADLVVQHAGEAAVTIGSIELTLLSRGAVVYRRTIDGAGFAPGIEAVPNRTLEPHGRALLFNPVQTVPRALAFDRVRFTVTAGEESASAEATPVRYVPRTKLILPLAGRIHVRSGSDVLSHHRRFDYLHPIAEALRFPSNFMRYGYDLFPDEPYGAPVFAPGDGVVVEAVGSYPDDPGGRNLSVENVTKDPMLFYGNRVVIDHGRGEVSMLAHLRPGSIMVAKGDRVRRGDLLGEIGTSGTAETPHLHYELRGNATQASEGVPPLFTSYLLGEVEVGRDLLVTGTFVRSTARYRLPRERRAASRARARGGRPTSGRGPWRCRR